MTVCSVRIPATAPSEVSFHKQFIDIVLRPKSLGGLNFT
jgi:hypothetical protein